jgi:hypothetical protein
MGVHQHHDGGARISTTPPGIVEQRATPAGPSRSAASAGLVGTFLALLLGAALATAAPAAAVDDTSRPDARVTHGPSCRPGGLVVEVVAGTSPYSVRLATTRTPSGEDDATLAPGQTVELRTGDVAYGETIDGRLEFAAQDGTGVTYVDELEEYSFTRPTKEDCDAIADPSPTPTTTDSPPPSVPATTPASPAPTTSSPATTAPTSGRPTETTAGAVPIANAGGAAPQGGAAGDVVTVQASGFTPGERVVVQWHGSDDVLATATAGPDGTVRADVRIPEGTEAGTATVHLTGAESEVVADVALRVAAAERPAGPAGVADVVPLAVAAAALVAAVATLFSVLGRQRAGRGPIGSV